MCSRWVCGALVIAAVTVALSVRADEDEMQAARLRAQGAILPLGDLLARAQVLRPGRLIDVRLHYEKEHSAYVYELMMLDPNGMVWEVEFDATSGALVELEQEDD